MNALANRRMIAVAAATLLLPALRSLAGAATLGDITVSPPVLHLRPCETVTLEITGRYDDGTMRDLSAEPGLVFAFETGNAAQNGPGSVVMNGTLDDALTVTFDGIDSAPVPVLVVSPQDLSLCTVIVTSTTTTQPSVTTTSTTTTSSSTTTTSTTSRATTTTPAPPTTTSTLPPAEDPDDPACGFCVHDRVQHRFRIENHVIFHREQVLQDRCAAVEFPRPVFEVAADGTQSSIFDVQQVVEGSCGTTLTDPDPHLLDDRFQPIANPDRDLYGAVFAIDRRPGYVRFDYTHPTTPPDDGDKFRVIRIGIFYVDRRDPGAGERLVTVLEVRVYRTPVLMVHGLWSDAGAFAAMEQALAASNYEPAQLYRLDYRNTNDSSFTVNYPLVAGGIDAVIQQAADANLASGKVDVVTHSMGGVLSRLYVQNPGYGEEVRRIVTCNTPHAGSQMANLLLDRSFDPQGLICSLLSQAMSSPSVPNRGCYNGAVADMQVSSFATTNFLNLGVHPTDIEVHGLATVFDPNTLPDVSSAAAPFGVGPFLVARLLRGCGISLVDDVFNHDDSDLIVSATSQAGGLSGSLTSLYPDQAHMGSTANPDVIDRVKELLNEPRGSSSFTRAGFSPSQLGYTTPSSVCPLLRRAQRLGATRSAAAPGITITSPAQGTSLTAGSSLRVEVAGSPEIATVILVLSQPGSEMMLAEQPGPDAAFDVDVPLTALGQQNVVVAGIDAEGRLVAVSDTLSLDVQVPAALTGITIYPPVVYLQPCGTASLVVTGHYEDGVDRDLSAQPGVRMTFATGNAAQSGASGIVLNSVLDDAVTISFDGIDGSPVPIRALVPDDLGSCVVATTSTTTLPSTTSTTVTAPSTTTTTSTTLESTATSTTTTPETSTTVSTTTTPASSTTTSTLAPGCQADPECDDGDACTVDVCASSGCNHVAATGLAGAGCLLSAALSGPLCPADTIDPKLEEFATAKLQRALELVAKAELATKPKRQQRLLDKASKVLGRIQRHKPGPTADECLETIAGQIDDILGALSELAAEDPTFTIGAGTGLALHARRDP
jgi:pimeloyl-ACP methyl ester carboxylesterase